MIETPELTAREARVLDEILERTVSDLAMVGDRDLPLGPVEHLRSDERPAGPGQVHIAFRLRVQDGADVGQGCLLVPLPDALVLAGSLLMLAPARLAELRRATEPDRTTKDAILEVGMFVAGAAEAGLRAEGREEAQVRFAGCQGVRPGVRPKLEYTEGAPLIVARADVGVEPEEPGRWTLMLPELGGLRD